MSEIVCTGVTHSFGATSVLRGVDLAIPAAGVTALIGPSGSGKSTLLRLIAGFERLQQGEIAIADSVVSSAAKHVPPHRRRIGYVPQDSTLFPHLTVAQNIGFGLGRRANRRARIGDLLDLVGLAGLDRRYPHELSGGQQHRVALARALAIEPHAMLLDEPFAALDANLRTTLRREILSILRDHNTTTVLVTHDQDEALSSADVLGVLDNGQIHQFASADRLYTEPADRTVATFLGDANLLEGSATDDGTLLTPLGPLPCHHRMTPGPVEVMVRPEQLQLHAASAELAGWRVDSVEYFGHDALYRLRATEPDAAPGLLVRSTTDTRFATGDPVDLTVLGPAMAWSTTSADAIPDAVDRESVAT